MDPTFRIDAKPLTRRQTVAVRHLLSASALCHCAGVPGRVVLHTNLDGESALTVGDLGTWSWSTGEELLIGVLARLVDEGPLPPGSAQTLDLGNRIVVQQALALALPQSQHEGLERLLDAVETTDAGGSSWPGVVMGEAR